MARDRPWIVRKLGPIVHRQFRTSDILLLAFVVLTINFLVTRIYDSLGYNYPETSFLFFPADRFGDFFKIVDALHIVDAWPAGNQYEREGLYYYKYLFPCTATIYFLFAKIIQFVGDRYAVYTSLIAAVFLTTSIVAKRKGHEWWMLPFFLVTYPFIYAIDRGNIAIVVFPLILFVFYLRNTWASTFALAVATSIKLTPIIFLVPLVLKEPLTTARVFRVVALTFFWLLTVNFVCIGINGTLLTPHEFSPVVLIGSLLVEYSGYAIGQMAGLAFNSALYLALLFLSTKATQAEMHVRSISPIVLPIFTFAVIGFVHLLRSLRSVIPEQRKIHLTTAAIYLDICLMAAFIKTAAVAVPFSIATVVGQYFVVKPGLLAQTLNKYLEFEKMVFVASISFTVFMPATGDYYLTVMLLPLLLFPHARFSFWYFVAYGLLLGAKNFPWIDSAFGQPISLQVFINPALMILMLLAEFDLLSFMRRLSASMEQPTKESDQKVFALGA